VPKHRDRLLVAGTTEAARAFEEWFVEHRMKSPDPEIRSRIIKIQVGGAIEVLFQRPVRTAMAAMIVYAREAGRLAAAAHAAILAGEMKDRQTKLL
jgi:hypothetical protein